MPGNPEPFKPMSDPSPFSYRLRVHHRARHVRLRVTPHGELVITVPPGFDKTALAPILARRADWIRDMQARQARQREVDPRCGGLRPREIRLAAIDEHWQVHYRPGAARILHAMPQARTLRLAAEADDAAVGSALRHWLQRRARAVLPDWLAAVSAETGLCYRSVGIRGQRSRWGSCSARGHISLNRNLLFLPPDAVRYLLVHELCHTLHLNHSPAFWQVVAQHQVDYRAQEACLREAATRLPLWVHPL